jgi:Flp pilus assembly protein TadD
MGSGQRPRQSVAVIRRSCTPYAGTLIPALRSCPRAVLYCGIAGACAECGPSVGAPSWDEASYSLGHICFAAVDKGRRNTPRRPGKRKREPNARPNGAACQAPDPGARARLCAVLLLLAGLTVYANSFVSPFVFDDQGSVVENAHIRRLWPIGNALSWPAQSSLAGRPIVNLSLAINYALGGLAPWGYRVGNLAIHICAALVLFGIIRRTLRSHAWPSGASPDSIALSCALVWLVHPLQTEVVNYITQRTESMMGLCYLVTLYASVRAMQDGSGRALRWSALAVTACATGMASKESMVTAPIMVLLYDRAFEAGSIRGALRDRRGLYAGLAATWILLAVLVAPGPRSHSAGLSSGITPWVYLMNQPRMVLTYLRLSFRPTALVLDYGPTAPVSLPSVIPSALFIVALMAGTLAAWVKYPAVAFLGTWFFVTLAPASSIVPIATEVGAERRMYLPLAAVVVMTVMAARAMLDSARLKPAHRRSLAVAGLAAVCCGLSWLTVRRNVEYHSESGLWRTVLARHPHGRARYQLGVILAGEGRRDEALALYRAAVVDCPDGYYGLGFELAADGKYDEAIAHLREYIRLRPDDLNVVRAHILLGRALLNAGRPAEAVDALQRALFMRPGDADVHGLLADAWLRLERYPEAAREYRERIKLVPTDPVAHESLGVALVGLNLDAEAVPEFTNAVALAPNDPGARRNLGNALAAVGRLDDAVREYKNALALAPDSVSVHNALATVLAHRGDMEEAIAQFRRSLELDPRNPETRSDYAALLLQMGRLK